MANRLHVNKIARVSLVHRGDDPEALIVLAKADGSGPSSCSMDHRALAKGEKCKECGYTSTGNHGRMAKGEGETTDDLDLDTLMDMADEVEKVGRKMTADRRKRLQEAYDSIGGLLGEVTDEEMEGMSVEKIELPDDTPEVVKEYVEALESVVTTQAEEVESLQKQVDEAGDEDVTKGGEESEEDIIKNASPEVQEIIKNAQADAKAAKAAAQDAQEIAKAERDARVRREFQGKADTLNSIPVERDKMADLMKGLSEKAPDEWAALEPMLVTVNNTLEKSAAFTELGRSSSEGLSAYEKIKGMANDRIAKSESTMTEAEAIAAIAMDNPTLYQEYQAELREK